MGVWITGLVTIWLSSTTAKGLPTLAAVAWPKAWPPRRLNWKLTSGRPCWSNEGWALVRSAPSTMTRFWIGSVPGSLFL